LNKKFIVSTLCIGFLSGCAGSAQHKVVSAHTAGDSLLSCAQIDAELVKTQVIIDAVNQDKNDISGADVVDGILWFPFNLIAKSENYSNALDAADKRIGNLQSIRKEKSCQVASADNHKSAVEKLSSELKELNELYKSGAITSDEYEMAKKKVLDNAGS